MMKADEVEAMLGLHKLGWGTKRIAREFGCSRNTVERAVAPYRRLLAAEAKATVRFETPPGRQLQIDFGTSRVPVGGGRSACICSWRPWGTRGGPT